MMDREGDKSKQPAECDDANDRCPNLKEDGGGMDGERYRCEVCGKSYYLSYDDMK